MTKQPTMDILDRLGGINTRGDAVQWAADAHREIERLRKAAKLAIEIIDTNLYHQREKVEDAASLLRQALYPT